MLQGLLGDALPGVGRALVMAGKITQQAADDAFRKAKAANRPFIAELIQSGAISAAVTALAAAGAPAWAGGNHRWSGKSAVLASSPPVIRAAAA